MPASKPAVTTTEEPIADGDCKKEPADIEMKDKSPPAEVKPEVEEQHGPALLLTNELALLFKKKEKEEDVLSWMKEKQFQEAHGGQEAALKVVIWSVLSLLWT